MALLKHAKPKTVTDVGYIYEIPTGRQVCLTTCLSTSRDVGPAIVPACCRLRSQQSNTFLAVCPQSRVCALLISLHFHTKILRYSGMSLATGYC